MTQIQTTSSPEARPIALIDVQILCVPRIAKLSWLCTLIKHTGNPPIRLHEMFLTNFSPAPIKVYAGLHIKNCGVIKVQCHYHVATAMQPYHLSLVYQSPSLVELMLQSI